MHKDSDALPTLADIEQAALRLAPYVVRTPLLRSAVLDEIAGGPVLLKTESLQKTGSFKIRGALNRILTLSDAERRAGVVAWSSGNHAQGVAAAAGMFGVPATIVMPADAPALKIANTRKFGANVVLYDRETEDREAIARRFVEERGLSVVPPYDHFATIVGQGTAGLEAVAQAAELGAAIDNVVAPVSGGGLIAGVGLAVRASFPDARIFSAEPAGYDDHRRSLAAGGRVNNPSLAKALCDALLAATPGELTWRINRGLLTGGYALDDAQVREAMAFAFQHLKLVVEPGGAVALAALLAGHHRSPGRTTLVILSGSNVDASLFAACLAAAEA